MKEFKTVEELRNDEELQGMCRSEWRKVKLNGKEVYACTTDQQYEDIICGGIYEMLENLFNHLEINTEFSFVGDFVPDMRDLILGNLKENGIEFVDVYEEY